MRMILGLLCVGLIGLTGCGVPDEATSEGDVSQQLADPLYNKVVGTWHTAEGYYCGNDPCFEGCGTWTWQCGISHACLSSGAERLNNRNNLFLVTSSVGSGATHNYSLIFKGWCSHGCDNGAPGQPAHCIGGPPDHTH